MNKIKKVDPKAAQSVFSFACPCLDICYTCIYCGCNPESIPLEVGANGNKAALSLISRAGTQTVNYNPI